MTRCTVSGEEPVNPDNASVPNSAKRADGQHVDHWTMCPGEIIKTGFKRPVRLSYRHVGIPGPKYALEELTAEQRARYAEIGYVKYERFPPDSPESGGDGTVLGRYWKQADLDRVGKGCMVTTSMPQAIAETYAPEYYGSTFCCGCRRYLPVGRDGEFVWDGTEDRVGT